MKIGPGTQDNNIGQAQNASLAARIGQAPGALPNVSSKQFGLDRVDVSDVSQTAAAVIGITGEQRAQRVGQLTQQYQSGQYVVNPAKLSQAIVDEDTDPNHAS